MAMVPAHRRERGSLPQTASIRAPTKRLSFVPVEDHWVLAVIGY